MTTLTSGGTTLLSGGFHLTSTAEEEDMALIAVVRDTAGSNVQTTSSTIADIDATNYVVTFTAPASGKVIVILDMIAQFNSPAAKFYSLGLRESTTTVAVRTVGVTQAVASDYRLITARFYISGLTPASSHTYKGAHKVTAGGDAISVTDATDYPRSIEVWEDLT
jgi:hypothetical protein